MEWLQLLLSGAAMGSIYGLLALGFVLVYRALGIINFAQGDLGMVTAYLAVTASGGLGLPLWGAYAAALGAGVLVATILQQAVYYPVRRQGVIVTILGTIGLSVALQQGAQLVWGAYPVMLASPLPLTPVRAAGIPVLPQHLAIMGTTALVCLAIYMFFRLTRLGITVQAAAQDRLAARLMGIRANRVAMTTFMLNALLTSVAGLLVAPVFFVTPDMGTMVLVKAFAAAILGGFGNVFGAVVGGLLVGVAEAFVTGYVTTSYKDALAFLLIIAVLLAFPRGLFGESVGERV